MIFPFFAFFGQTVVLSLERLNLLICLLLFFFRCSLSHLELALELVNGASHFFDSFRMLGFLISGFSKRSIVSALQFSETRVTSALRVCYFSLQVSNLCLPRSQGLAQLRFLSLYFRERRILLRLQLIHLVLVFLCLFQHLHLQCLKFILLIL